MEKISTFLQDFTQKSNELQQLTEKELQNAFSELVKSVNAELNESAQKIGYAIRAHEQTMEEAMSRSRNSIMTDVMKTWLTVVMSTLFLVATSAGVMWWQGNRIADNAREISRQQDALSQLNAKTWGVSFQSDSNGKYLVLPAGMKGDASWTVQNGKRNAVKLVKEP